MGRQNKELLENINRMDNIRAHRELLKQAFFNMDCSKVPVRKEINVYNSQQCESIRNMV